MNEIENKNNKEKFIKPKVASLRRLIKLISYEADSSEEKKEITNIMNDTGNITTLSNNIK